MHRKFTSLFGYVLAAGALLLTTAPASAAFEYVSAAFNVYTSGGALIAADSLSVTYAQAISDGSGTVYEITNTALVNPNVYGDADALSSGGTPSGASSAGPYYGIFGAVYDSGSGNFYLGFSLDPTGNDPYGSFGSAFDYYYTTPTQTTYSYTATQYLSSTLTAAGDKAAFVLTAVPVPEPTSMALLATGGFMLTAFGRVRRRK